MATSGTATWQPTILEMLEEAYERAGLQMRTGYDVTTGRRSFQLLMVEFSNMQLNMWSYEDVSLPLVAGTTSYALPADTIDVVDGVIRLNAGNTSTQSDIVISRTSYTDYLAIPNKLSQGQPSQYAIQRNTANPVVFFYQTPDGTQSYAFYYRRLRRLQDAGSTPAQAAVTADTPFRFYDAVIAGLALRIASKRPESMGLVPQLKAAYDEALTLAQDEDRDRAPLLICPYISQSF